MFILVTFVCGLVWLFAFGLVWLELLFTFVSLFDTIVTLLVWFYDFSVCVCLFWLLYVVGGVLFCCFVFGLAMVASVDDYCLNLFWVLLWLVCILFVVCVIE